jgi:hypothetical protein
MHPNPFGSHDVPAPTTFEVMMQLDPVVPAETDIGAAGAPAAGTVHLTKSPAALVLSQRTTRGGSPAGLRDPSMPARRKTCDATIMLH